MRIQLLVTFLLMTILLAGITGHAAYTPCKSPEGTPARQICEDLQAENAAANGTYITFGTDRTALQNVRLSLKQAYTLAQQPDPDLVELQGLYQAYETNKQRLNEQAPRVYQSLFQGTTLNRGADDPRGEALSDARSERLRAAFANQERERAQAEEARVRAKALQAEKQKQKAQDEATRRSNDAVTESKRADRQTVDEWSQVPRCFASGFPVGTSSKKRNRCDRVTDLAGTLKAMNLTEAKGLEKMKACSSSAMLCNPFTFGATKTAQAVLPICVPANKNASANCEKKLGPQQKAFRAELLKDAQNLKAVHQLHGNLTNSCGLTDEQRNQGVKMEHVLKAGRALGKEAGARLDDQDFVRTCTRLLGITSPLIAENPMPRDPSAAPAQTASRK